jgi:hypothetical protein
VVNLGEIVMLKALQQVDSAISAIPIITFKYYVPRFISSSHFFEIFILVALKLFIGSRKNLRKTNIYTAFNTSIHNIIIVLI